MRKILVLTAIIAASFGAVYADPIPDSAGTKFWLTMPSNYFTWTLATKQLYITSATGASGQVYCPSPIFTQNFSVPAGGAIVVTMPAGAEATVPEALDYRSIRVTANSDINVWGMNSSVVKVDGYLGMPVDALGTEYIITSYPNSTIEVSDTATQFAVVGTEDSTTVSITLSETTGTHTAGVPYLVGLNEGQVYYIKNDTGAGRDFTGTYINANKKVAVFGSHTCANIPVTALYCDYLIEQLMPITTWGMDFVICPLAGRSNGDTYRFVAMQNSTGIYLDGTLLVTLNAGQYYQAIIDGSGRITSTKRIGVTQFANSESYDSPAAGDPFMMNVIPSEQFVDSATFYTPQNFTYNYLNIVAPSADAGNVSVDGFYIPAGSFTAVGTSGYSVVRTTIGQGPHTITGTMPLMAYVYGFDWRVSYGFPAAAQAEDFVSTKTATPTITQTPTPFGSKTVTQTITPTRTITDTKTQTSTPTASKTGTLTVTATNTPTITLTGTETKDYTQTHTPSVTPSFTETEYVSPTQTFTLTVTPTISATGTNTVTRTVSATITQTRTATSTPSITPTFTMTSTGSPVPSPTITVTASPTPPHLLMVLKGVYPNPSRGRPKIVYWLSKEAIMHIKIFTVSGEVVDEHGEMQANAGYNTYEWDGKNADRQQVATGSYVFKLSARSGDERVSDMGKIVIVR